MVFPARSPMTRTLTPAGSKPFGSATNVLALTISRVVTPKTLLGLYTPCFLKTSDVIGMVELTGFEMRQIMATGQCWSQAAVRLAMTVALMLSRSSCFMPDSNCNNYQITSFQVVWPLPRSQVALLSGSGLNVADICGHSR